MEAAGSGSFKRGERVLLRTANSKEDIMVVFTVRYNPKKTAEAAAKEELDGKEEEGEKGEAQGEGDEAGKKKKKAKVGGEPEKGESSYSPRLLSRENDICI